MELFAETFQQKGFHEVRVNVANISVYVCNQPDKDYVIILFHLLNGVEWNKEQCAHVEEQLTEKLRTSSQKDLKLITFMCTNTVELIRDLYRQNNHTAVIDLKSNRLLIFEGMERDELNIFTDVEKVLQSQASKTSYISLKDRITMGLQKAGYANTIIVGLNILIFIILKITNTYDGAVEDGKLYWKAVSEYHEYYRILTSMFLHGGISHLLNNMLILACIGGILEKRIGMIKYCIIYLLSGIAAGTASLYMNMQGDYVGSIGASGAIFGVVGAVLWIVLINKGRVENLGRRQMLLFIFFSLYGGFTNQTVDNAAHIGGLIGGFILAILIYRKPKKRGVTL